MAKAGQIDHSGHPHPSTPTARALCRANGGTGSISKNSSPSERAAAKRAGLTEAKVPVAKPRPKAATAPISAMTADRHSRIMAKMSDEEAQVDGLAAAPIGIDADGSRGFRNDAEEKAATRYIASGYGFVNSYLRGSSSGNDRTKDDIKQLDAILSRSKLTQDVGVYRGVDRGRLLFGDSLDGDLTGLEWREKGYSSTTVNQDVADDFTAGDGEDDDDEGGDPIKMRIVLPKGSSAFQASDVDEEAEMILPRNSRFRVIKDRGEDNYGIRVIDVELVS